jgi:hypothetical protein
LLVSSLRNGTIAQIAAHAALKPWPGLPEFPDSGVVLGVQAPPEAILLVREADSYDEKEVVLDPYGLSGVHVVERLREK